MPKRNEKSEKKAGEKTGVWTVTVVGVSKARRAVRQAILRDVADAERSKRNIGRMPIIGAAFA